MGGNLVDGLTSSASPGVEPLSLRKVSFAYRGRTVLRDIDLGFSPGGVVALLGANGSGKTTLLKIMLGLLSPATGRVLLGERLLATIPRRELAKHIAYVPQLHRESFAYPAAGVVLMGRLPHRPMFSGYGREDRELALAALDRLGIGHLAARPYTEISGGERQLVLIARALAQGARLLVMDEPVNGLDYGNQLRLLDRIRWLGAEGITCIMTTHYPDHALMAADRAVLIQDGAVTGDGPPRCVITDKSIFRLYRATVQVLEVADNRICVPLWLA